MTAILPEDLSIPVLAQTAPLIVLGLTACWLDWRDRRIPNWLCGILAVLGLAVAAWLGGGEAIAKHAIHAFAALIVGMVLFRFGVFGGGDAKFYAAVAAWFPIALWAKLLIHVSLAGLGLVTVWFVARRLMGKKIRPKNPTKYDALPYGIAIALGAFWAMFA
ncbi:A24 family peptidase [Novosphingobium ginsenosidimutans]|uniref:A24 family peptidase n=1 Tax=Novosphingobium ginsenosidimutans TaxID=1176536 RepID=UPI001376043A|nr:prepilin peptidase [Novosphingobium ginsenosidimutans]